MADFDFEVLPDQLTIDDPWSSRQVAKVEAVDTASDVQVLTCQCHRHRHHAEWYNKRLSGVPEPQLPQLDRPDICEFLVC